ncbi:conserved hypothetical protein [Histoplasma capsulatum G186AR]|uniref:Ribosomal protein S21 n=2 Tax=Ajellomyces capsulatus TaxID=5037 RepID=C0NZY8_AJECG|nr:uncharacterized protein HCBG_08718 [Histoplasma capsulatum G186AR]EEH03078.1 conserved hypothetical protein [Histoplasma capsulatum G186AR]KAG5296201.1 ribosomal_S21 superfamily domain-containing protein [Histoplasma capsulatum]QSS74183.1 ribosomal_S21 superfamily domain-containing protein [Histoplasma capsulatum G186AR]
MEVRIVRSINLLSSSRRSILRQCPLSRSPASIAAIARPINTSAPLNSSEKPPPSSQPGPEGESGSPQQQSQLQPQPRLRQNQPVKPWSPGDLLKGPSKSPTLRNSSTSTSNKDDNLAKVTDILNNFIPRSNQPRQANNPFQPRTSQDAAMYRQVREAVGQSQKFRVPTVNMRLGPELGRTVAVDPKAGVDVATAFQMMETRVRRNKVKSMMMKQRFHVRRGQLKKQLRMERWQKLFKMSFQHTVRRCEKLRKQGW